MKVAVIGVGSMGQNHARIYFNLDNVELVAVADSNPQFLEKVSKHYHTKAYLDYREMLQKEEIDAISIAVPTKLHREVAVYCLKQKKHVLLEKPIATTEEEAKLIIQAAKDNGVKLMIGHIERFNTAVIELKKRLDQGELGEIYKIDAQRIGPFPVRIADVGVIIDLSVHDLDIIDYLLHTIPTRLYAETQQKLSTHHEDSLIALLRYDQEILATLNINYLSPTKIRQLKVFGKKGMFKVDYLRQILYFYENNSFGGDNWDSVSEGDMRKIHLRQKEPLEVEIESFLNSIRHNTEPAVSGEHGLKVLALANLLLKSAREKSVINLFSSVFENKLS